MSQKITLEVIKKEQLTKIVYQVTFRLVSPSTMDFRAGQNMMLMIGDGINRTMSIASPPNALPEILMVHDTSPMGVGSKWTIGLKVGDIISVVAPTGGALSFIDSPKKKVMIATGTGIAPFRSMILDKSGAPMALYWGLRYEEDVYWKEEFQNRLPFYLILSKPTDTWQGLRGHVTEHVIFNEKDVQNCEYYLCGNKAMIEEVRTALLECTVPKEQIKTELFF